ncbi:TRAP transporter substrate-binding protein [Rickettsiaceae bacterium]|nr:TRAP transporter substrate-binding protein [Rickettsiaceae bacterium]
MKLCKIILVFYLSLFIAFPVNAEPEQQSQKIMHLSHFLPRTSITHKGFLKPWADKITKLTNGRLKVKVHPGMSLGGKPPELLQQARSGAINSVWTVVGYTPGQFPKTEAFELPFISDIPKAVVFNMAINDFYEKHLQDEYKDFHVVLLHAHAPGALHLKDKPLLKLEDFNGLKIRTPNRIIGKFLENTGASPVAMPLPDTYEALNYGLIEGALVPFEVVVPMRLNEKAKHHVIAPFYTTVFAFLINKEFYNSLPKDVQKIINDNSGANIAYDIGMIWDNAEKEMIEKVKNKGGKIYYLSDEEIKKGKIISKKIANNWAKERGENLYNDAVSLLNKYQEKYGK